MRGAGAVASSILALGTVLLPRAVGRSARAARQDAAHPRAATSWHSPSWTTADDAYLVLKYLHVIGATVLLGTGAGIAFFMLLAHRTGDAGDRSRPSPASSSSPTSLFTATAVVAQPVTGVAARLDGRLLARRGLDRAVDRCSTSSPAPSGCRWCGCRCACATSPRPPRARATPLPDAYHRLFRCWFAFGFPAFAAVLAHLLADDRQAAGVVAAAFPSPPRQLGSARLAPNSMTRFRAQHLCGRAPGGHEGWAAGICRSSRFSVCQSLGRPARSKTHSRSSTPKRGRIRPAPSRASTRCAARSGSRRRTA